MKKKVTAGKKSSGIEEESRHLCICHQTVFCQWESDFINVKQAGQEKVAKTHSPSSCIRFFRIPSDL